MIEEQQHTPADPQIPNAPELLSRMAIELRRAANAMEGVGFRTVREGREKPSCARSRTRSTAGRGSKPVRRRGVRRASFDD